MEKYGILAKNAPQYRLWLAERGGVNIWDCVDMSDLGKTWSVPVRGPDGAPTGKPHWSAGKIVRTITDASEVEVITPKLVKRFHVAVRMGAQGMKLKVTDGGSRRIRREVDKAGDGAFCEFDYETQDALIFAPGEIVPLSAPGYSKN